MSRLPRYLRATAIAAALALSGPLAAQEVPSLEQAQTAAQLGEVAAQVALADRYHRGDGVTQDFAQAAEWYAKAAAQGDPKAQNQLGRYRFEGLGGPQDRAEAMALFEQAAKSGMPQYVFDLAAVLEQSPETIAQAATLYAQAAEGGFLDAAVSLGVLYQAGTGVPQDFARAKALYEGPARQGHPRALNNLGLLYVRGTGVPQDYARAAEFFSAAADRGLKTAMTNLGVLYENGFGVPLDEARAAELYRQAGGRPAAEAEAEQTIIYDTRLHPVDTSEDGIKALQARARAGDPVAMFQFGWVLLQSEDAPFANFYQAGEMFRRAAEQGYGPAMVNLGTLYFEGRGVPQDFVLGQMWMIRAAGAGVPEAAPIAQSFSDRLTPAQINDAQGMVRRMVAEN